MHIATFLKLLLIGVFSNAKNEPIKMDGKKDLSIEKINEDSDKAEIVEELTEVLKTEGPRVVIAWGLPNQDDGIDIHIRQYGFKYLYEIYGFMREASIIVDSPIDEE